MLRRFLVLAALLVVAGCCCRPDPCNPCDQPNPCDPPCPQPPPQPPPGGGSDYNCATWASDDCDPGSGGVQSRPSMLDQIEQRVHAAGTSIPPSLKQIILNRIGKHRADKNCKGNFDDGAGDCAGMGQVNCGCLLAALQAAMNNDWMTCSTKLAHGH